MHPSTRSIRSLRNTWLGLVAFAALSACGGDDDDSGSSGSNTTQSGTGGNHAATSGSGGASTTTGNHPSGGSGGTSGMDGGNSGSGGGSGGRSGGSGGGGDDAGTSSGGDAGSSCFSPTQNLDTAYEQGSVGCPCKDGDASQCIQGVALICDGTRWTAVQDGPCAPGPEPMRLAYSSMECTSLGAVVVADPGDGSLFRDGCPDGKEELGIIDNSKEPASGIPIEGALCCACAAKGGDCTKEPVACGARAGDTCDDTELCAYVPGKSCGRADAEARCRPRPTDCTMLAEKVCGCDSKEYDNPCSANAAGTGVNNLGPCTTH